MDTSDHEYILCYAKNTEALNKWGITSEKALIIKQKYESIKASGITDLKQIRKELKAWIRMQKKSNEIDLSGVSHYDYVDEKGVFYPGNSANTKPGDYTYDIIHPNTHKVCAKPANGYRWPASTFWAADKNGDVLWGEDETTIPKIKKRIETATELLKSYYYEDGRAASKALDGILGKNKFNNPKPIRLITKLLRFTSNNTSTILDFFAGSGTTLHATMQLNSEDGGNRQCILVTNNENKICEEVTYERNKRVIEGYTTPKGEAVEGLKANNLRYYQIDHVEREGSMTAKRKLMAASADLLCIKHDIYNEETIFGTLTLKPHIARYFCNSKSAMLIIYKVEAIERIVEEIKQMPEDTNLLVYVFSTNNYAMDADFEDVSDRVTLCALPAAIYNAYLKVLPKKGTPKTINKEEDAE